MLDGIRGLMAALATALVAAYLASQFGRVHPALDTLAAFRLHIALALALLAFFSVAFSALITRAIAVFGLLIAAVDLGRYALPGDSIGPPDLTVWTHNLRYDNPTQDAVIDAINLASPDVVLLQEVSGANTRIVERLRFRTEVVCPQGGVGGPAVLSRLPLADAPGCAPGLAWARLKSEAGTVTVASIHLHWPWPYGQAAHIDALRETLADLPEPLLIAGDFNNAPWSHALDTISATTGTRVTAGLRLTFDRPEFWPGLALDHVLASEDLLAATEAYLPLGSDHTALITRVNIR